MKKLIAGVSIFLSLAMFTTGCALLSTALGAGAAYGLYMATKK
ncbi:MAG: hypothetical protein V1863_03070 [Candidatus Omnitrophota bacterium]